MCSCNFSQVALTEWWAEKYSSKGVGFYSMHPGWADTPGVAKSLLGFSEKYNFLSSVFMLKFYAW